MARRQRPTRAATASKLLGASAAICMIHTMPISITVMAQQEMNLFLTTEAPVPLDIVDDIPPTNNDVVDSNTVSLVQQAELPQTQTPTSTQNQFTTATCTDTPLWLDAYGDGCSYYATEQICNSEGTAGDGGMGIALDNCCTCGGGTQQSANNGDVGSNGDGDVLQPVLIIEPETTTVASVQQPVSTTAATTTSTTATTAAATTTILTTTTTTTATTSTGTQTDANGDVIVNPGGTCGNKDRGNGICANGKCCSKHGWCGTTPAHCDGTTFPPSPSPTAAPNDWPPPTSVPTTAKPTSPPTTGTPTASPTARDWSSLTPGWRKFCGPRLVGGYEVAKAECSPLTECGRVVGETAYGDTGNDCPKGFMCYDDVECEAPSRRPSVAPSISPTKSDMPTVKASEAPSDMPTMSIPPTQMGQTKPPTSVPTVSPKPTLSPTKPKPPTVPPVNLQNSITTRGSYCGGSFQAAVNQCSPSTSCSDDDDCDDDKECFPNISCTFHASATDNFLGKTPAGGEKDDDQGEVDDDVYETETNTDFGEEYSPDDVDTSSSLISRGCCWSGILAMGFIIALLI